MTRTFAAALALSGTVSLMLASPGSQAPPEPPRTSPPNEPALVEIANGRILMRYHGGVIFEGMISGVAGMARAAVNVYRTADAVDQVIALTASSSAGPLEVSGTVTGSAEAFPAEADRPLRGLPIVRHASGLSRSLRNHAVYDRRWDWALSVDDQPRTRTRVTPVADTAEGRTFRLEARGREILLRFRPRFYQQHRGLRYFEPWTYAIWPSPIAGWCSWFAFFDKVTEHDIKGTADVVAHALAPFGYEYVQMDDGYQRATGAPEFWLEANQKFPSGLPALAGYIKSKGLKPAIWTNAAFSQTDIADRHRDWFVRDPSGGLARGNWIDLVVDGSNPDALAALVRPIYRELRRQGWEVLQARCAATPEVRGLQRLRRLLCREGRRLGRGVPVLRAQCQGGNRPGSVPDGVLGRTSRVGGHRRRMPAGHRRLLVCRAGSGTTLSTTWSGGTTPITSN